MEEISKEEKKKILDDFEEYIKDRTKYHFGYPYNLEFEYKELSRFFKYSINNLGDPFDESNYGVHSRKFELEILNFFSKLWKIKDYWGYVTNSGTEGNLQSILIARENFPDGIIYASEESHYSIFKAAHFYRMKVISIPTSWNGSIRLDLLMDKINYNIDKPIIINVNIGTTVKGAIDNILGIFGILKELNINRENYYIHCDGALFGMILPFLKNENKLYIDFTMDIDSIAISGHKFLGCPMPCGVMMTRKELIKPLLKPIEYLNSVDSTITGSRNGLASLFIWNVINTKGIKGFKKDAEYIIKNAIYLEKELKKKNISCFRNTLSSTVVIEKPVSNTFIKKWQLACVGNICHIVVMPSINKEKIDLFLQEIENIKFNKNCVIKDMNNNCLCNDCINN